jgi:plasmid stabilization system protein ParE
LKIRFTPRAEKELAAVLSYIEQRSPQGADSVRKRINELLDLISKYPWAAPLTTRGRMRRLVMNPFPYLIFYEQRDEKIIIHAIRHTARKPSTSS